MAAQLFVNNFETTISGSLASGATSVTLASGTGVPAVAAGDWWLLTIEEGANLEIIKVTSASSGSASLSTIVRQQEGTTSPASFSSAATVKGKVTKGTFQQIQSDINATAGTVTSVSTAAANNGVTATWNHASPTPALTIGLGAITPTSVTCNPGGGTSGSFQGGDFFVHGVYVSVSVPNSIGSGYATASDGYTLWINYRGYNDSNGYFRNFTIGDGKHGTIAAFVGSTKAVTFYGPVTFTTITARIDPRIQDVTSTFTSITPDVSTADIVTVRGASSAITLNNPTGTPLQGQKLVIRIKDNGTARAISYGTEYRNLGATKPTTTVLSKTLYLGLIYNSTDSKWDLVAVAQEA